MKVNRLAAAMAFALLVAGSACTAEVEDAGSVPEVDVQGGEAPTVDVDPANVEVGTDTSTVVTPEVNVEQRP
jgi:hypothetical protein